MGLQGEWWLDTYGNATFADGDVGDLNHGIMAFYAALGMDWENPEVEVYPDKSFTAAQVQALLEHGAPADAVEYLKSGRKDARDYMMQFHGWIRVADNTFQLLDLDDTALKHIQDFINAEYPEDENPLEDDFVIEEVKPEGLHLRLVGQELLESGKTAAALKYSAQRERPEWHNPGSKAKLSETFYEWFNGSKVVDSRGQPLVVYHGTVDSRGLWNEGFKHFDYSHDVATFFATDSKKVASTYAALPRPYQTKDLNAVPEILALYLRIHDPLIIDAKGMHWSQTEDYIDKARQQGRDGVIFLNSMDSAGKQKYKPSTVYVFFSATQAKSADRNDGTWDVDDPNLKSNPSAAQTETLPTGTILYHGSPEPYATEILRTGKLVSRSGRKMGGGTLEEGGLLWFARTAAVAKQWAEGTEARPGDFTGPGQVFRIKLTKPAKIISRYAELTAQQAQVLNSVLGIPDYKPVKAGDRLSIAAHRAFESSQKPFEKYGTQRGEMRVIWPVILRALGMDGFEYSGTIAVAADQLELG